MATQAGNHRSTGGTRLRSACTPASPRRTGEDGDGALALRPAGARLEAVEALGSHRRAPFRYGRRTGCPAVNVVRRSSSGRRYRPFPIHPARRIASQGLARRGSPSPRPLRRPARRARATTETALIAGSTSRAGKWTSASTVDASAAPSRPPKLSVERAAPGKPTGRLPAPPELCTLSVTRTTAGCRASADEPRRRTQVLGLGFRRGHRREPTWDHRAPRQRGGRPPGERERARPAGAPEESTARRSSGRPPLSSTVAVLSTAGLRSRRSRLRPG